MRERKRKENPVKMKVKVNHQHLPKAVNQRVRQVKISRVKTCKEEPGFKEPCGLNLPFYTRTCLSLKFETGSYFLQSLKKK